MDTNKELPEGYTCETCGTFHDFPIYVFAHWRRRAHWRVCLSHTCDCGAEYEIIAGHARQAKAGNVRSNAAPAEPVVVPERLPGEKFSEWAKRTYEPQPAHTPQAGVENECAGDRLIKHFKELDFTVVAKVHSHYVEFSIYDVVAWEYSDPSGKHEQPLWPRADADCSADTVETLEESEVYLSGSVKWDGCSNWHFDEQDRCMLHGCCKADIQRFGDIMTACWDWTSEILPTWD